VSKRIVAANIRLKRAYDSPARATVLEFSLIDCGPAVSRRQTLRSTFGPRTSRRAPRCESGSDMILLVGTSFKAVTRTRYIGIAAAWAKYAHLLKEDGLPSSFLRIMKPITTRLS
jgi:hypothetical protein